MESLVSTFHIDVKLLTAQLVNFAVVFAILYWFALRPLAKLMRERSEKIEKGLKDAGENARKLEATRAEYKSALNLAKAEAEKILASGRKDAEIKRSEIIGQAQREVERLLNQGKIQLESEKKKIITEARREVADLVVRATERVLPSSLNMKVDAELVRSNLENIV